MKRIVMALIIGLVMFGLSGAASWYLNQKKAPAGESSTKIEESNSEKAGKDSTPALKKEPSLGLNELVAAKGPLVPAIKPQGIPDAENVAQLANQLRMQTEVIKNREQQLTMRQKNLEIIYEDLKSERKSLDDFRNQVNSELKALVEKITSLEEKKLDVNKQQKQLQEEKDELKKTYLEMEKSEQPQIKKMAAILDSMEADPAGELLQQMADSGKMDMAVQILASMRERQASRLLGALPDKTTTIQIMDRMKNLKKSP